MKSNFKCKFVHPYIFGNENYPLYWLKHKGRIMSSWITFFSLITRDIDRDNGSF